MSIYTHKHHIVPRHMGGSDDPSNLIELTVEEHADAHRQLYEKHGCWQDRIAWQTLSGQISMSEAKRQAAANTNRGRKLSDDHKRKISESSRGHKKSDETRAKMSETQRRNNNFHAKYIHTPESNAKRSATQKGIPKPKPNAASRAKMSESARNKPRSKCPHCSGCFTSSMMTRWHGDKCKQRT